MTNVLGADISFYQDDPKTPMRVSFEQMRNGGANFAIIRAGQKDWIDRDFADNWKNARSIIPRGSYWFYDSRADPKSQAELWASVLSSDAGELPLWCDFEDNYGGAWHGWRHWYDFITHLQNLMPGKEIGIYTGYYYWVENTIQKAIPIASLNWFAQFPLWVANYNVQKPMVPMPWQDWIFWQFTDNGDGTLYGVESLNIDLNYFNGTLEDFQSRFKTTVKEVNIIMSKYEATVINTGTRLRDNHSAFDAVITSFAANTLLEGDEIWTAPADGSEVKKGDVWLKVTKANGVPVAQVGWTAIIHKGGAICKNFVTNDTGGGTENPPTTEYQDLDLQVNIYQGALTVKINNEEWMKKPA